VASYPFPNHALVITFDVVVEEIADSNLQATIGISISSVVMSSFAVVTIFAVIAMFFQMRKRENKLETTSTPNETGKIYTGKAFHNDQKFYLTYFLLL